MINKIIQQAKLKKIEREIEGRELSSYELSRLGTEFLEMNGSSIWSRPISEHSEIFVQDKFESKKLNGSYGNNGERSRRRVFKK